MTRTPTKPWHDKGMWRRLGARVHPDAGGSHKDLIWASKVEQLVCSGLPGAGSAPEPPQTRPEQTRTADPKRFRFPPDSDFEALTRRAAMLADGVPAPYRAVLRLLRDCERLAGFEEKQRLGATYERLAAIAHAAGFTYHGRQRWYEIAASVLLPVRRAGHLLGKPKRGAA